MPPLDGKDLRPLISNTCSGEHFVVSVLDGRDTKPLISKSGIRGAGP
jgi:hypothetical protein